MCKSEVRSMKSELRMPDRQTSYFKLQKVSDNLHIFPHLPLRRRIAEEIRGMEGRDQLRAAVVVHAAAEARDRIERAQQRLRRELAERDDDLRLDDVDLPEQKRLARVHFVRLRIAIL